MQAVTVNGKPRFNLVRQRNGGKFVVKKIKMKKDHSFRDEMASLALKVRRLTNQSKLELPNDPQNL